MQYDGDLSREVDPLRPFRSRSPSTATVGSEIEPLFVNSGGRSAPCRCRIRPVRSSSAGTPTTQFRAGRHEGHSGHLRPDSLRPVRADRRGSGGRPGHFCERHGSRSRFRYPTRFLDGDMTAAACERTGCNWGGRRHSVLPGFPSPALTESTRSRPPRATRPVLPTS